MKKKMLAAVMSVVMVVVCMTGCSKDLTRRAFEKTARKYGMREIDYIDSIMEERSKEPGAKGNSLYYSSKNAEEADALYYCFLHQGFKDFPKIQLQEFTMCFDNRVYTMENGDHFLQSEIYWVTASDKKAAIELYEELAKFCKVDNCAYGEENGYNYSIRLVGGTEIQMLLGVYIKDNTVIYMRSGSEVAGDGGCAHFFCKKLGLVSPLTLKDNE